MIFWELFRSFFQIGLFSIGGGYAAMPLIRHQVSEIHTWLTVEQFADIVTIAEMTPGPIAINAATFVGIRVAGLPGAIVATAGCIVPSCLIVMLLSFLYYRFRGLGIVQGILGGLRPAVIAMIASAALSLLQLAILGTGERTVDVLSLALFGASLGILRWRGVNPMWIIWGSGVIGLLVYFAF